MHFGKLRCRRDAKRIEKSWGRGVIDRYRTYLPVSEATPIVTVSAKARLRWFLRRD